MENKNPITVYPIRVEDITGKVVEAQYILFDGRKEYSGSSPTPEGLAQFYSHHPAHIDYRCPQSLVVIQGTVFRAHNLGWFERWKLERGIVFELKERQALEERAKKLELDRT